MSTRSKSLRGKKPETSAPTEEAPGPSIDAAPPAPDTTSMEVDVAPAATSSKPKAPVKKSRFAISKSGIARARTEAQIAQEKMAAQEAKEAARREREAKRQQRGPRRDRFKTETTQQAGVFAIGPLGAGPSGARGALSSKSGESTLLTKEERLALGIVDTGKDEVEEEAELDEAEELEEEREWTPQDPIQFQSIAVDKSIQKKKSKEEKSVKKIIKTEDDDTFASVSIDDESSAAVSSPMDIDTIAKIGLPKEVEELAIESDNSPLLFFQLPLNLPKLKQPEESTNPQEQMEVDPVDLTIKPDPDAPPQFKPPTIDKKSMSEWDSLPFDMDGKIGSLKVYKSGKVRMVIGGHEFDAFSATPLSFPQQLAYIDTDLNDPKCVLLGNIGTTIDEQPKTEEEDDEEGDKLYVHGQRVLGRRFVVTPVLEE